MVQTFTIHSNKEKKGQVTLQFTAVKRTGAFKSELNRPFPPWYDTKAGKLHDLVRHTYTGLLNASITTIPNNRGREDVHFVYSNSFQ